MAAHITPVASPIIDRAERLDATWREIDGWSMPKRHLFLAAVSERAAELVGEPKWRNLIGVVDFFDSVGWGQPGRWSTPPSWRASSAG